MRDARGRARMRMLMARRPARPLGRALDVSLAALLCVGLVVSALPTVKDLLAQVRAQQVITSMSNRADQTYDPERMDSLRQAQTYNLRMGGEGASIHNGSLGGCNGGEADILGLADDSMSEEVAPYEQQLAMSDGPAMCWVEIPAISLHEPVYHGTSDEALASGVGHVEGTSLPVGGLSSHCVLAAHSGMQNTRMFDELDLIGPGDLFVIHTLGDAYCYEVYQTEVLLPQQVEERCLVTRGEDLCTLMTCTPYGINTHRLLVHGRRVAYRPNIAQPQHTYSTVLVNSRTRPLLVLAAALGGLVVLAFVARRIGRARRLGWQAYG